MCQQLYCPWLHLGLAASDLWASRGPSLWWPPPPRVSQASCCSAQDSGVIRARLRHTTLCSRNTWAFLQHLRMLLIKAYRSLFQLASHLSGCILSASLLAPPLRGFPPLAAGGVALVGSSSSTGGSPCWPLWGRVASMRPSSSGTVSDSAPASLEWWDSECHTLSTTGSASDYSQGTLLPTLLGKSSLPFPGQSGVFLFLVQWTVFSGSWVYAERSGLIPHLTGV